MNDAKIMKIERIFCIVTGIIAFGLIVLAFISYIFIPAACIMSSLCLFSLWYTYKDMDKYKKISLLLFIFGVILLLFAVIYTIIKTI